MDSNKDLKYKKKKIRRIILLSIVVLLICLAVIRHYYKHNTGPRSGTVVDAKTGQPIEGAVVSFVCFTSSFMSGVETSQGRLRVKYETQTDKNGKYFIPNQHVKLEDFMESIAYETMLIFKSGYGSYQVETNRGFIGKNYHVVDECKYSKNNNLVKLYRWEEGWSYEGHLREIRYFITNELMEKELKDLKLLAEQERLKK